MHTFPSRLGIMARGAKALQLSDSAKRQVPRLNVVALKQTARYREQSVGELMHDTLVWVTSTAPPLLARHHELPVVWNGRPRRPRLEQELRTLLERFRLKFDHTLECAHALPCPQELNLELLRVARHWGVFSFCPAEKKKLWLRRPTPPHTMMQVMMDKRVTVGAPSRTGPISGTGA